MKHLLRILLLFVLSPLAHAELKVFACEPEWAALARALAGPDATVFEATSPREDPHVLQARPALIAQLRTADLLVCTGADLEVGWLPLALRQARNPRLLPSAPGHFLAADQVALLEVPVTLDRAQGDVHPQGNPHIQTDPRRMALVTTALGARLGQIDPPNAAAYRERAAELARRLRADQLALELKARGLRGARFVVHHAEWVYLFDWLGLATAGALEPRPGLPPAAGHLATLKAELAARPAKAIVRSPLSDPKPAQWLAAETGLPVIELPHTVGATPDATDLPALYQAIVERLVGGMR